MTRVIKRTTYSLICHGEVIATTNNRAEADRMRVTQRRNGTKGYVTPDPTVTPRGKYIVDEMGNILLPNPGENGRVGWDAAEKKADEIERALAKTLGLPVEA